MNDSVVRERESAAMGVRLMSGVSLFLMLFLHTHITSKDPATSLFNVATLIIRPNTPLGNTFGSPCSEPVTRLEWPSRGSRRRHRATSQKETIPPSPNPYWLSRCFARRVQGMSFITSLAQEFSENKNKNKN